MQSKRSLHWAFSGSSRNPTPNPPAERESDDAFLGHGVAIFTLEER
jgi:hypothetical protein